jgi:hypothetical protein
LTTKLRTAFWATGLCLIALGCGSQNTESSKRTPSPSTSASDAKRGQNPKNGNAPISGPAGQTPADTGPQIDFSLTVDPILQRACGNAGCHGTGSSFGAFVGDEAEFVKLGPTVLARLASEDKSLVMPQYGFPVDWSDSDRTTLARYLRQKGISDGTLDTGEDGTTTTTDDNTPATAPVQGPKKLCLNVSDDDKASGLATTFDQVTAVFTANCGGGNCHTGAAPHGFVGRTESLENRTYAAGIVADIKNGSMPKGKSMSAADKAAAINYLCARFDF